MKKMPISPTKMVGDINNKNFNRMEITYGIYGIV